MSSKKITGLWESFKKDFKYLEQQSELLSASLSSFSSTKLALLQSHSKSTAGAGQFKSTEKIEYDLHLHSNNSQYILDKMKVTVMGLERIKDSILGCFVNEPILSTALKDSFSIVFKEIEVQMESFSECHTALLTQPLLSHTATKSLLALIIHKPLMAESHLLSDVDSLLLIKTTL